MDPLSFTASLITVAGVVAVSSRKIHELRKKLKNAPKDVENLLEQFRTFEGLLKELKAQLQDHQNSAPPQETLQQVWGASLAQMQEDVQSLQAVLSKMELLLKKKSRTSRVLLLARQMLSEKEVEKYQKKIDTHCGTLTSIQAMVCGRKLDKLSQHIDQRSDENKTAFRTVTSQLSNSTSQLSTEVKTGLSAVSSQLAGTESANSVRHQALLSHLNNGAESDKLNAEKMDEIFQRQLSTIDINEAGFQAVQSSLMTASLSNSEENKTTHAMLNQCQSQIQHIIQSHITFGAVEHSMHSPSNRPRVLGRTSTKTTVFCNHYSHRLPIGMLQIRLNQISRTIKSRRSSPQVWSESKIAVEFVPPRWLSNVLIKYSMKLSCDLMDSQFRWGATLKPLTVNDNPFFINALDSLDVEGVQTSFAMGLAKPTDYVIDRKGDAGPWYSNVELRSSGRLRKMLMMVDFMVKSGLPGRDSVLPRSLSHFYQPKHQNLQRDVLENYVKYGGDVFATRSSVLYTMNLNPYSCRIDWIPGFLFNSSEAWLVDDLSALDICLIGTLAHVDAVFRDWIKKELARYRSPVLLGQIPFADRLFETRFGKASIGNHYRSLRQYEKSRFLILCCRTGTVSIIEFLIDIGIDVNGGDCYEELLGHAAAAGNIGIVRMLLEFGENSSLALKTFLHFSNHLSDALFKCLLEMLVENARPTLFSRIRDPLLAIIESSRAIQFHSKAPEILLNRQAFAKEGFGREAKQVDIDWSYMYHAIMERNASLVELLIHNGAHANVQISQFFHCWFEVRTWITFAVMCGAASCADVLIKYGADVTALDGAGRSAVQLAKANALASHPRSLKDSLEWSMFISDEQDAETLAVVERAFNLKTQGSSSLKDCDESTDELTLQPLPQQHGFMPALQPLTHQNRPMSTLHKLLAKVLSIALTPIQISLLHNRLRHIYRDIRKIWSLSFYEALLMRSIYVLSYTLLLGLETHAFVKGQKRMPMPSRFFLSAAALLTLALVWGSSQMGFSWGSITA